MIMDPATMRGNAAAGFTSIKGRSHTFDVRADGYARSEAIGALHLCQNGEAQVASVQGSVDNDAAASPSGAVASKWCWATQPETKNMSVVDAQYHIQHQTT